MTQKLITKTLYIDGMTCISCENRIKRQLNETKGIIETKVNYSNGRVSITFDPVIIQLNTIEKLIEALDYKIIKNTQQSKQKPTIYNIIGVTILIFSLYMLLNHFGVLTIFNMFPQAKIGMNYSMLFMIGLFTSMHCVAMCGGINLSQCIAHTTTKDKGKDKYTNLEPSFLYNFGRVISYTVVGAIVGALGQVVSFSGTTKGFVQLFASVFMIIMGLNILNIFPSLRKLHPRIPKIFVKQIRDEKRKSSSPFYVGLLNGLMPCGPLQAMQLYALSTGSPIKGAVSMLLFSLGTVPLMFGLGAISSFLSKKFASKMMTTGAILVILMGIGMFNNGISLSGFSIPFIATNNDDAAIAQVEDGIQTVTTKLSSGEYEPITVEVDTPVKWIIEAEKGTINGCNNEIIIHEYDIQKKLNIGETVITFTPTKTGTFTYSCWMGMIRSTITVVEDGA